MQWDSFDPQKCKERMSDLLLHRWILDTTWRMEISYCNQNSTDTEKVNGLRSLIPRYCVPFQRSQTFDSSVRYTLCVDQHLPSRLKICPSFTCHGDLCALVADPPSTTPVSRQPTPTSMTTWQQAGHLTASFNFNFVGGLTHVYAPSSWQINGDIPACPWVYDHT